MKLPILISVLSFIAISCNGQFENGNSGSSNDDREEAEPEKPSEEGESLPGSPDTETEVELDPMTLEMDETSTLTDLADPMVIEVSWDFPDKEDKSILQVAVCKYPYNGDESIQRCFYIWRPVGPDLGFKNGESYSFVQKPLNSTRDELIEQFNDGSEMFVTLEGYAEDALVSGSLVFTKAPMITDERDSLIAEIEFELADGRVMKFTLSGDGYPCCLL